MYDALLITDAGTRCWSRLRCGVWNILVATSQSKDGHGFYVW